MTQQARAREICCLHHELEEHSGHVQLHQVHPGGGGLGEVGCSRALHGEEPDTVQDEDTVWQEECVHDQQHGQGVQLAEDVDEQLAQCQRDGETTGDKETTITRTRDQVVEFELLVEEFSKKTTPQDQSELQVCPEVPKQASGHVRFHQLHPGEVIHSEEPLKALGIVEMANHTHLGRGDPVLQPEVCIGDSCTMKK